MYCIIGGWIICKPKYFHFEWYNRELHLSHSDFFTDGLRYSNSVYALGSQRGGFSTHEYSNSLGLYKWVQGQAVTNLQYSSFGVVQGIFWWGFIHWPEYFSHSVYETVVQADFRTWIFISVITGFCRGRLPTEYFSWLCAGIPRNFCDQTNFFIWLYAKRPDVTNWDYHLNCARWTLGFGHIKIVLNKKSEIGGFRNRIFQFVGKQLPKIIELGLIPESKYSVSRKWFGIRLDWNWKIPYSEMWNSGGRAVSRIRIIQ